MFFPILMGLLSVTKVAPGKSSEGAALLAGSPAQAAFLRSVVGMAAGRDKRETRCEVPAISVTSFGCDCD